MATFNNILQLLNGKRKLITIEVDSLPGVVQAAMLRGQGTNWIPTTRMSYDDLTLTMLGTGTEIVVVDVPGTTLSISNGTDTTNVKKDSIYQSNKVENVNTNAVWNNSGELMHLDKSSCTLTSNVPLTGTQTTFFPIVFNIPKGLKTTDEYRVHIQGKIGINIDSVAINQDFHITPITGPATGITMTAEPFGVYRREYMPIAGSTTPTDYYANRHDWNVVQVDLGSTRSLQVEETYFLEIDFVADVQTDSTYTGGNVGLAFHNPSGIGTMILQEGSMLKTTVLGDYNKNS